jgi:hypothetical protein
LGDFLSGQIQVAPDGAHIGHFDHMNACAARPALRMVGRFTQTLNQIFAELVHLFLHPAGRRWACLMR